MLAISGGVDSSVCGRARGARGGRGQGATACCCPSATPASFAPNAAARWLQHLGIAHEVIDIAPALEALGCYRQRDEAIRRVFPAYGDGWKCKIAIAGGADTAASTSSS